jgi:hypothetical protein
LGRGAFTSERNRPPVILAPLADSERGTSLDFGIH